MDSGYLIECASLLLRWMHVIFAIAWVGSSFYFIWLDNSLKPPVDAALIEKGVGGELWAVHGGGFYNPQKYLLAPPTLPHELHWFKWESYSTWLSGFFLMGALYYSQAGVYMIDAGSAIQQPGVAVMTGIATLVIGWLVYDGLCRLLFNHSQLLFGAIYYGFVVMVGFVLCHLLSGRAAFLHVGAMIATTMSANVFFWIIPGQKKMVAALRTGQTPEPIHGKRGKQRSAHNNYLVLPVIFCMLSNHYPFIYSGPQAALTLATLLLAAALTRHFFNLRHKGIYKWQYPAAGLALLVTVLVTHAPQAQPVVSAPRLTTLADIRPIIDTRCLACHSEKPTKMPTAPNGIKFDQDDAVRLNAPKIYQQVVQLKAMPLGNLTGMTEAERGQISQWFKDGAK
ncbi:putative membrane protein [Silvimonas terrae]|uniref:Putative membrane protein n=1 Tax=Silvimonas terrae TaxID=300266 RepID=A0A840RGG8_9NEIS|nr:urate hydroxylase PuuD [Silvimonas terrae]MBB5191321.1 putative membrane protein [Silvimonas terrae]